MSRALRDKISGKVKARVIKALDSLDIQDDIKEVRYPFREAGEDLRTIGDTVRDGFSRNNWKLMAELKRDAERQVELKAFLDPEEGGAFASSLNAFEYDALPAGRLPVRILTLHGGKDMATIECTLRVVDLDDGGLQYEALSYCWGDPDESLTPICCNGRRLDVTKNLKMALNNLRPEQGERTLWVDAICINQKDKQECARQVLKMGEIYGRAARAVVWLGETCAAYRTSFDILKTFSGVYGQAGGRAMKYEEMKNSVARIPIEGYPSHMSFKRALYMVQELEEAPWFSRMWVLQEVALAPSVSLVCGRQTLPWDTFEKAMLVRALVATQDRMARKVLFRRLDHGVLKMIELHMAVVGGSQDRSILTLLNQFRGHKAGMAADKVYAILSLTETDVDDIGLRVDYSIPIAQLYTDLAKGILRNASAGGLDLLSVPRVRSDLSLEMPSWVPDWSNDAQGGARPLAATVSRYGFAKFCASGPFPEPRCSFKGNNQLVLRGYVVDHIERLSTHAFTDAEALLKPPSSANEVDDGFPNMMGYEVERSRQSEEHYKPIRHSWKAFLRNPPDHVFPPTLPPRPPPPPPASALPPSLKPTISQSSLSTMKTTTTTSSTYSTGTKEKKKDPILSSPTSWPERMRTNTYPPTGEMLGVAYVRTMCADSFPPFISLDVEAHKTLIMGLDHWLDCGDAYPHGMWGVLQRLLACVRDIEGEERVVDFSIEAPRNIDFCGMLDAMLGRRLMWSRDGYFGAVPEGAREGDAVVLVEGCRVPLVLRPVRGVGETGEGGCWQLVGDCFVHGAMYGERWEGERGREVVLV